MTSSPSLTTAPSLFLGRAGLGGRFAARPQGALGTGGTINWGIFKRHFWGELLRHPQAGGAHLGALAQVLGLRGLRGRRQPLLEVLADRARAGLPDEDLHAEPARVDLASVDDRLDGVAMNAV